MAMTTPDRPESWRAQQPSSWVPPTHADPAQRHEPPTPLPAIDRTVPYPVAAPAASAPSSPVVPAVPPPATMASLNEAGASGAASHGPGPGLGFGPVSSYAPPAQPPAFPVGAPGGHPSPPQRPRKQRTWLVVALTALVAAAAASGGTALLTREPEPQPAPVVTAVDTPDQGVDPAIDGVADWQAVAAAVRPSVVAISVQVAEGGSSGSGVILDTSGHVLTNFHVVEGAEAVQVMLWDGRIYEASVIGVDPTTDLAVLNLVDPPDDLTAATLGTSDGLEVGQGVMAVGNPLGLDSTVTTGIVSALDRPVSASSESSSMTTVTNAIQIDAAVNPGNSGGPLFDARGFVIGITSSIATLSGAEAAGSIGLGFAIPVDLATDIAEQLLANGQAEHAFLGVLLQAGQATADGVTRQGAQIIEVSADTPAAGAGLQAGDVIVGIDDDVVGSAESLTGFVREYSAGDRITLTLIREGQSMEVVATLAAREEDG